jgi:hypothetical protein
VVWPHAGGQEVNPPAAGTIRKSEGNIREYVFNANQVKSGHWL